MIGSPRTHVIGRSEPEHGQRELFTLQSVIPVITTAPSRGQSCLTKASREHFQLSLINITSNCQNVKGAPLFRLCTVFHIEI